MTLKQWANNGWLKPHTTSAEETGNLLAIVRRDAQDSQKQAITGSEADELIKFVRELEKDVLAWLKSKRPELLK